MKTGLCAAVRGPKSAHSFGSFETGVFPAQRVRGLCADFARARNLDFRRSDGVGCARVIKKPAHPRTDFEWINPRTETRAQRRPDFLLSDAPLTLDGLS